MPKYLTSIDLTQNELLNAIIHNVADLNSIISPFLGQVAYNTTTKHLYAYNGSTWILCDSTDAAKNVYQNMTDGINTAVASGLYDTFTFSAGSGISVTINPANDSLTVTNTDLGSAQYIFKKISDGTNLAVADSNDDTLVFAQNGGLTVVVNPATDTVTYSHADTSTQESITEAPRTYISGVSVDGYGHVTALTTDPEVQYSISAETVAGGANLRLSDNKNVTDDVKFTSSAGLTVSRTDYSTITINHNDTSSITDLTPATRTFVSGMRFDTFGHVTALTTDITHEQNTDTGTTSSTFVIDSDGTTGITLANAGGELQVKDKEGVNLAHLRVQDLYVMGTQTIIHSDVVDIGDAEITLNADITTSIENSDGGVAIKRLAADDVTRKDAKITFNNLSGRWQTTFGSISGNLVTAPITNKVVYDLGDGTNTSFVVTHNLNTRDISVTIRESSGTYAQVFTDVEFTTVNTITVRFAEAPTTNQYVITIIG